MTRKMIAIVALVVLAAGGAFFWSGSAEEELSPFAPPAPATTAALRSQESTPGQEVAPPPAVAPVPVLVAPGSRSEVQQAFRALSERQLSDGRHFVQFSTADARGLALYDSFEIRLDPAAAPVTGRVEKVSQFEGMKRVSGTLLGDARGQGPFSMTVSSDGSYAVGNFALGGRSYSLESKNGAGWVTNPDEGAKFLHRSDDVAHSH